MTDQFCTGCGRARDASSVTCPGCGAWLGVPSAPSQAPQAPWQAPQAEAWPPPAAPGSPYGAHPHQGQPHQGQASPGWPPVGSGPQGAQWAPPGYWGYPGYPVAPKTSNRAIWVLILGVGSLVVPMLTCFLLGPIAFIPAIVALCLAPSAKREIRESNGQVTGTGLVTGGVVVSWITIALTILFVILIVVGISAGWDDSGY